MNFSESLVRGKVAETIVGEMLQDAGYSVYRFGYEVVLQNLIQRHLPKMNRGGIEAEKLRTMPDFIVMKDGDVSFIEVKFRSHNGFERFLKEWGKKVAKYWPETRLMVVRPEEPYFSIGTVLEFAQTGTLCPLAEYAHIEIDKKIIQRYTELVSKYCDR